jgi:hypothetical protein
LQLDLDRVRQWYASLSDESLQEIDRNDLVEDARLCYDEELAARGLKPRSARGQPISFSTDPPWLRDAVCASAFVEFPGQGASADASECQAALKAAGIPCRVIQHMLDPGPEPEPPPRFEYRVMVPGALNLHATSILDRDFFNIGLVADWRTHFATLSDEDLTALDPAIFCAGLQDRITRLQSAYAEEMARRGLDR